MNYKKYDKVLLITGETAFIVEVFGNGDAFVADIEKSSGTDTAFIYKKDIKQKLSLYSAL